MTKNKMELLNILFVRIIITEIQKRQPIGVHVLVRTLDDVIILELLVESLSQHTTTSGNINLFFRHIEKLFLINHFLIKLYKGLQMSIFREMLLEKIIILSIPSTNTYFFFSFEMYLQIRLHCEIFALNDLRA